MLGSSGSRALDDVQNFPPSASLLTAVPADPFPAEPTEETRSVNSLNSMIAELLAGDN